MENHPVLYSYRRCPYAMRARISIYLSGIQVEQREIVFWDKPESMLAASPKGTVPVLILPDGEVIDESRDIMLWAFKSVLNTQQACSDWLPTNGGQCQEVSGWIDENDTEFKAWLDKYKYADRFPEHSQEVYRQAGERFLQKIEATLAVQPYLLGDLLTMTDIGVFPFVRQFVNVDKTWFAQADYPQLKRWLKGLLESSFFTAIMKNRPVWEPTHKPLWVSEPDLQNRTHFLEKAQAKEVL